MVVFEWTNWFYDVELLGEELAAFRMLNCIFVDNLHRPKLIIDSYFEMIVSN